MAAQAAQERRQAIRALTDSGISKADIARALGISRQRVTQLTAGRW
jgi:biotin operon repressor